MGEAEPGMNKVFFILKKKAKLKKIEKQGLKEVFQNSSIILFNKKCLHRANFKNMNKFPNEYFHLKINLRNTIERLLNVRRKKKKTIPKHVEMWHF